MAIDEKKFGELISGRAQILLCIANHLPEYFVKNGKLTRPLLGQIMLQSIEIEELLDSYGAKNNRRWRHFRTIIATAKLFSTVGYELLHIYYALPSYKLLPIQNNLQAATSQTLEFVSSVLLRFCTDLMEQAAELGIKIPSGVIHDSFTTDEVSLDHLENDANVEEVDNVDETVILLASSFLNLAEECKPLQKICLPPKCECNTFTADSISEEQLRQLELKFHNLQSVYDTYVFGTDIESKDPHIAILRGHITIVFHLLRVATFFAHYFERHVRRIGEQVLDEIVMVDPARQLDVLIGYAICYTNDYIISANHLCQEMLKRYAIVGEVSVAIPKYRGFHVRPSALIAKIVLHYGSEVEMILDDELCNAAMTLDIFRINEKINAIKRKWLTVETVRLDIEEYEATDDAPCEFIRNSVLQLAAQGKIIIYEQPLQIREIDDAEAIPLKRIVDEIAYLQAEGKIDIHLDIKVTFRGDRRVLKDLALLAEHGYGEDSYGNNIALPKELRYLRR